jgi:hypothetical protein
MNFYVKYIRPLLYLAILFFSGYGLLAAKEELYFFGNKLVNWFFVVFALVLLFVNLRMTFKKK